MRGLVLFFAILFAVAPVEANTASAAKPLSAEQRLDGLFAELAKADSEEEADNIRQEIERLFLQSGSPTIDLLMSRSQSALKAGDTETARKVIDSVTKLAPSFAEGWHLRAQLQAASGDDAGALISLQKTVTLNPREFNALIHLAEMLEDYGDKKAALAAYRKVQKLYPANDEVNRAVRKLSRDVEGQKI